VPGGQKGGHKRDFAALLDELPARQLTVFRAVSQPTLPRRIFAPARCALTQRELQAVHRCSRSPAARGTEILKSQHTSIFTIQKHQRAGCSEFVPAREWASVRECCHGLPRCRRATEEAGYHQALCVCVCVYVCVCARARALDRERERERESARARAREKEEREPGCV
jgi:hypothetical protein